MIVGQRSLDSDVTREIFDNLPQDMIEVDIVKLQTIGERECLSLPKEEPKDLDMATNRTMNNLVTFQLQLRSFKSSLKEQFSFFRQSFITVVLLFKIIFYENRQRILTETPQKSYFIKCKNNFIFCVTN